MIRSVPASRVGLMKPGLTGLTTAEVQDHRKTYGINSIVVAPPSGWRDLVRDTARDPMVWFLVGTAVLFAALGDWVEAAVLAFALLPIIGMDAYLHKRTQASTEGLSDRLASHAQVIRNGRVLGIPALELVPGDLAVVSEGEPFPGDCLIISGEGIQVDESTLTGESLPVRKKPLEIALSENGDTAVDTQHWGAAGTRLLTGEAHVRVIYIGKETLYGQIVQSAQIDKQARTPLQEAINSLVSVLLVGAIVLCVILAVVRYWQGFGIVDALLSAVVLAVAALPEEFPVIFSMFLGVGVYRLARRQALVRRAVAVENIGRITCICTDKTGTLTEGRLQLAHIVPGGTIDPDFVVKVASTASRRASGDPLDILLRDLSMPFEGNVLAVFPFTEDRRKEVTVVREASGSVLGVVKGAPETVMAMSGLAPAEQKEWQVQIAALAGSGHKVIACASCHLQDGQEEEPLQGFQFSGILAFEDPVRDGVRNAVAQARAAQIRVIMITGDHPATAMAIAGELGIGGETPRVIEGAALSDALSHTSQAAPLDFDVVARANPAQKLDLVRALQASGHIVAVTGDGVNDAPALQGADIGIAMGERGTRTARDVASIVLLDDNFRTIVHAIAEGRQLFLNLKLSFAYLLIVHLPLVATATLIPLLGFPLLYLPVHIVWLELIIHPTALLVFQELASTHNLDVSPRQSTLRFFSWQEWLVVGVTGLAITVFILLSYYFSLGPDQDVTHARSVAMVVLIVSGATVTSALSGLRTRGAKVVTLVTLVSAIFLVQFQPLSGLLHLSPLHLIDWLISGAAGLFAGAVAALLPFLRQRHQSGQQANVYPSGNPSAAKRE